jgi:hypothetical protein
MSDRSGPVNLEKAVAVQGNKEVEGDGTAPSFLEDSLASGAN